MKANPTPLIKEISPHDAPTALLLLADPSAKKIAAYLPDSQCFAACRDDVIIAVAVVFPLEKGAYELMSIAVTPSYQHQGIGTRLLKKTVSALTKAGGHRLEVGTGTFGHPLAFYQKHGFRVTAIERDFFLKHYPEPIFEHGIQLLDMLRLSLDLPPPTRAQADFQSACNRQKAKPA